MPQKESSVIFLLFSQNQSPHCVCLWVCVRAHMFVCDVDVCGCIPVCGDQRWTFALVPGSLGTLFSETVSLGPGAPCKLDWLAGNLQGVTCLTSSALRLWASVPMPGFTLRSARDQSQPLKLAALSLPLSPWPHSFPAGHFWRCL